MRDTTPQELAYACRDAAVTLGEVGVKAHDALFAMNGGKTSPEIVQMFLRHTDLWLEVNHWADELARLLLQPVPPLV